jgi:NADPH-dependent ferric siderophore reductase
MLAATSPEHPTAETPGRLSKALQRLLMKRATVVAAEAMADRFHLITLEGADLKDIAWKPGQKVQVAMGGAFVTRTYTPIAWNAAEGRACILGYAHGPGPGSAWLQSVKPGDGCQFFGPRSSLNVGPTAGPLLLFGDETSFGLAYALAQQDSRRSITCHFEVDDLTSANDVIAQLEIPDVTLHIRKGSEDHLGALDAVIDRSTRTGGTFVITGRARAVQHLRQNMRRQMVPASRVHTKAYWAAGKKGLD